MMTPTLALVALIAGVTGEEAALLTSIVATAAQQQAGVDVLTSEDVRKLVQVEAEKEMLGCDEEASCLAEIAGAMGARAIIYGSVGELGDLKLVTLNLYDTAVGRSAGRAVLRGERLEVLSQSLESAVASMFAKWDRASAEGEGPLRLLVMDLDVKGDDGVVASSKPAPEREAEAASAAAALESAWRSPWTWSGVGTAVVGVGGFSAGVLFNMLALDADAQAKAELAAADAQRAYDQRDLYRGLSMAGVLGGASFLLLGAGLIAVGWMELASESSSSGFGFAVCWAPAGARGASDRVT